VRRLLLAVGLLAAALGSAGCSRMTGGDGAVIDAWAQEIGDRNVEVDRLLAGGDRARARQLLASIVAEPPRSEGTPGADLRRALLQDACFRLARLALDDGDPELAIRHTEAGLALGERADLFTANLLVARATAREARGQAPAALADYERALRINQTLLEEALAPR
jgi:tetratricopeptide (TPR) repeat protein